jgi:hypothetical protein
MVRTIAVVILVGSVLSGCVQTSALMLDGGVSYPPTQKVQLLTQAPSRPFKPIAMLEARGPANTPITDLLEGMRQKAAEIGADAVMPTQDAKQEGLMYNPWLGGYHTISIPIIRGVAVRYTDWQ